MPAEVSIKFSKPAHKLGSIRVKRFSSKLIPTVKNIIKRSGFLLERQIKENLTGPSHTKFPGNPNPFPGVVSGKLRSSITTKFEDGELTVIVGPNVEYARIHELGGGKIPKRAFLKPAFDRVSPDIVKMFAKQVFGNL